MITRRVIVTAALALTALAVVPARVEDKPAEIRIGTQKGGLFPRGARPAAEVGQLLFRFGAGASRAA
ncbi:hypothetical protein [Bradyrhizobium sp. WSM1743]|uniref:hypothetical protein n=1 Tax=Bradyrhizobium sp. WSM1743 TaxID=318996 RepID=UPI00041B8EA0|nr:hypothetical protein [Bradyrhizobium sp. WSM1743]